MMSQGTHQTELRLDDEVSPCVRLVKGDDVLSRGENGAGSQHFLEGWRRGLSAQSIRPRCDI